MQKKIAEHKATLIVILFLGFTVCIYAPFELYALNTGCLWFGLHDFWYIPLLCGGAAIAAAALLGIILNGAARRVYEGALFGTGLAVYLQGNFLNLKLGMMTGQEIRWADYRGRMLLDLAFWLVLIVLAACWRFRNGKNSVRIVPGISLFLTLVQAVTLTVLLIPLLNENKALEYGYPTEKYLTSLSEESNVLIFVLDQYDDTFFHELIEEEPEFTEELDGFTYYENMTGCYVRTNYAVPFMLSGNYCLQGDPAPWKDSACEERVYWDELLDHGYEMSIYSEGIYVPARAGENSINFEKTVPCISNKKAFTVTLYRLVMCKYFPDIVKPYVWLQGTEFGDRKQLNSQWHEWNASNLNLADRLEESHLDLTMNAPQFKFIHVSGTHEPYNIDEEGKRTEEESSEKKCIRGSIKLVLRYLDEMEELGIYDNSAVIITADHGTNSSEPTNPLFLIKPAGSRGTMKRNHAPVSQKDLGATVLELADLQEASVGYGDSALSLTEQSVRERWFYMMKGDGTTTTGNIKYKLVEYKVDSKGNDLSHFSPTGKVYDAEGNIILQN